MEIEAFLKTYHVHPNPEQKQAISHRKGPALVLAGPGSGKTTVIAARCARLVDLMKAGEETPGGILTVAFNRAAAKEMGERYKQVYQNLVPYGESVTFSTFHAFCNRTIYRYEQKSDIRYKRLPEKGESLSKENLLYTIYWDLNQVHLTKQEVGKLSGELGKMRMGRISNSALSMSNFRNVDLVYETYEKYKQQQYILDFDDMLYLAKGLLEAQPDLLEEIHRQYRFVQVDEGQDLSQVQLEILQLLPSNIFIVGDDDQGIYGFRGVSPESIVQIETFFPGCRIYSLKQNYRSTQSIVEASSRFIEQNAVRFDKSFITERGKGRRHRCKVFLDDRELLSYLYCKISSPRAGECGILYRNGASSILPAILCCKENIPFRISGGMGSFFQCFVTADILDLLMDTDSQKRILPRRPQRILREFLFQGYLEHMQRKCEALSLRFEDMLRYFSAWDYLAKGLQHCREALELFRKLKQMLIELDTPIDTEQKPRRVHLSTIHSAKGLEYDSVFILDLYKGEFPKSGGEEELQEERRLFYVAMTRAKKALYCMYPSKRCGKTLEPGEFFLAANSL